RLSLRTIPAATCRQETVDDPHSAGRWVGRVPTAWPTDRPGPLCRGEAVGPGELPGRPGPHLVERHATELGGVERPHPDLVQPEQRPLAAVRAVPQLAHRTAP